MRNLNLSYLLYRGTLACVDNLIVVVQLLETHRETPQARNVSQNLISVITQGSALMDVCDEE